jgi:hypothetical protein
MPPTIFGKETVASASRLVTRQSTSKATAAIKGPSANTMSIECIGCGNTLALLSIAQLPHVSLLVAAWTVEIRTAYCVPIDKILFDYL